MPKSAGLNLDVGEKAFGLLESSTKSAGNPKLLRERLSEQGYLYLAGFLDRNAVLRAQNSITERLAAEGLLHPDYPAFEGVPKPDQRTVFRPDLAFGNRAIESLIYGTRVIEFYRALLGGPIRHYDFTPGAEEARAQERSLWNGWLAKNPVALREKLGGRWLTAEFKVGDVVTFGMALVHGSLDNQTHRIRFSSDSRYQLASEAVDDRWIGPAPAGHSSAGKRGRIC